MGDNMAGFMYGTLCDENEMEQWNDLAAVCVRGDGACGECLACVGEVSPSFGEDCKDVKLMDFREACPEGYGFPATPAGCERAVQVSGFQKGEWSNEGPYEESHPTCFWADHDNNKAGFMYGTLCDENEMEQWGDLGAVCVRCAGACGGCFACDGEVSTVEDHEGGLWFVVAILGAVAAIASCAVVACLCYFSSRQRATPQGAMTEMAAAPGAQVVQIP